MPSDANFPRVLSFFLSHATSSMRKPCLIRSFSSVIFSIACLFAFSKSKSSVGVRCTTMPNRGFTSLVLFPSSLSHSVLSRATLADSGFLNRITYPVFVVPIPATCASCVDGALNNAVRIWVLAESVGRYRPKVFPSLLSLSLGSTNDRCVLIRTQFCSLSDRGWVRWGDGLLSLAATAAHDLGGVAVGSA